MMEAAEADNETNDSHEPLGVDPVETVIISGGGVVMADGVQECIQLAERLGAPVVNSYLHNDSFPPRNRSGAVRWVTRAPRPR